MVWRIKFPIYFSSSKIHKLCFIVDLIFTIKEFAFVIKFQEFELFLFHHRVTQNLFCYAQISFFNGNVVLIKVISSLFITLLVGMSNLPLDFSGFPPLVDSDGYKAVLLSATKMDTQYKLYI